MRKVFKNIGCILIISIYSTSLYAHRKLQQDPIILESQKKKQNKRSSNKKSPQIPHLSFPQKIWKHKLTLLSILIPTVIVGIAGYYLVRKNSEKINSLLQQQRSSQGMQQEKQQQEQFQLLQNEFQNPSQEGKNNRESKTEPPQVFKQSLPLQEELLEDINCYSRTLIAQAEGREKIHRLREKHRQRIQEEAQKLEKSNEKPEFQNRKELEECQTMMDRTFKQSKRICSEERDLEKLITEERQRDEELAKIHQERDEECRKRRLPSYPDAEDREKIMQEYQQNQERWEKFDATMKELDKERKDSQEKKKPFSPRKEVLEKTQEKQREFQEDLKKVKMLLERIDTKERKGSISKQQGETNSLVPLVSLIRVEA